MAQAASASAEASGGEKAPRKRAAKKAEPDSEGAEPATEEAPGVPPVTAEASVGEEAPK